MNETEIERRRPATTQSCPRCAAPIDDNPPWRVACRDCERLYPPSLLKAAIDEFDYALKLKTGEVIEFNTADIHGDYVTLHASYDDYHERAFAVAAGTLPYRCPRGLDVRVDQIVWCADAPNGS